MTPQNVKIATFACPILMLIGAIGPWAKVTALGATITANGFDRDGIIVVIAAVLIIALLVVRRYTVLAIVAAVISAATCIYDYFDVAGIDGVSVGWGLWLALLASLAAVAALVVYRRSERSDPY